MNLSGLGSLQAVILNSQCFSPAPQHPLTHQINMYAIFSFLERLLSSLQLNTLSLHLQIKSFLLYS